MSLPVSFVNGTIRHRRSIKPIRADLFLILRSCLHHDIDTIRMCHSSALTQAKNDLRSEASTSCLTSSSMGKALGRSTFAFACANQADDLRLLDVHASRLYHRVSADAMNVSLLQRGDGDERDSTVGNHHGCFAILFLSIIFCVCSSTANIAYLPFVIHSFSQKRIRCLSHLDRRRIYFSKSFRRAFKKKVDAQTLLNTLHMKCCLSFTIQNGKRKNTSFVIFFFGSGIHGRQMTSIYRLNGGLTILLMLMLMIDSTAGSLR